MKKRRMKARVCVPAILILIVITCVAYGTWSWVGATAWCAKYDDGWGIAHGSVGWGGMAAGSWATSAAISGQSKSGGGAVHGSSGGSSHISGNTNTAASYGMISGTGNDGNSYSYSNKESGTIRVGAIVARRPLVSPCFLHTDLGMKSLRREKDPVYGVL